MLGGVLAARGRLGRAFPRAWREWAKSVGLGLLNPLLYYAVLFKAYDLLPAQVAQPLNYTWALTLGLLSVPLLGQRFRPRLLVAGLVAYAGVGFGDRAATLASGQLHDIIDREVRRHFPPEFINRVDDVVVFHPLGMEEIRKIVDIQLGDLQRRLAERDIRIELSDAARDRLGEAGFDPVYGARPLKRAIQQQVENPLAEAILR